MRARPDPVAEKAAVLKACAHGRTVTAHEVSKTVKLKRITCAWRLGELAEEGMVEGPRRGRYRITLAGRRHVVGNRPRVYNNSLRARLWRALRAANGWVPLPELLTLAARKSDRAPRTSAYIYLRALEGAGYVASRQGATRGRPKHWRLTRDTGRRHPVFNRQLGIVSDPNEGGFVVVREVAG